MQIEVSSNIPLPDFTKRRRKAGKYPFASMNVGDSFFAPGKNSGCMSANARMWGLRNNRTIKVTCRTVTENGVKGVRVWRIA